MIYFDFDTLKVFKKHEGKYYSICMTLGQLIVRAGKMPKAVDRETKTEKRELI